MEVWKLWCSKILRYSLVTAKSIEESLEDVFHKTALNVTLLIQNTSLTRS